MPQSYRGMGGKPTPFARQGSILRPAFTVAALLLAALPASSQYPGQVSKNPKTAPELRAISVLEWTGEPGKPKNSRLVPVAVLDGGELQDGAIYLARPEPLALAGEVEYELQQNGKPIGLYDIKNAGQEQGSWVGYGTWKAMPVARPKPSMQELARTLIDDDAQSDKPVLHRKHHADDPPSKSSDSNASSGSSAPPPSDPDRPTLHKKSGADTTSGGTTASATPGPASDPDRPTLHKKDTGADDSSATPAASAPAADSGQPTLHRRDSGDSSADTSTPASASAPATDPDRPTLHKKDSSTPAADTGSTGASSTSASDSASDPDRPTLHKKTSDDASSASAAPADDPDRPVLKKTKKKKEEEVGYSEGIEDVTDPDRPRLKRGAANSNALNVAPSLMGLPPDMEQAVAVSDARTRPEHPWSYSWANPDDETKMKSSLEEIARDALGLNPPPPSPAPAHKRPAARKNAKPAPPPPAPESLPLVDEQFRVFELAYGSGATLVLTARSGGPVAQQKFVTLVAQPDLYGATLVLLKSVTDGAHLDQTPRMRLVDAVDALADNRGELLFEVRAATQRQFALYRVLRGQAEKLFVGGGGEFGSETRQ
jgi:hypothetical protein